LSDRSTPDRLRELIDAEQEWDEPLWRDMAELGFLGAAVPEAYGGLGMTELDLGVISEELGRANAALPFFSSIVLAADLIRLAGNEEQKAKWLPKLASGETVATFAYCEGAGGWSPQAVQCTFDGTTLAGVKQPVADAGIASLAIVLAKRDGALVLALAELDHAGVSRVKLPSFDHLRAHYVLGFDAVPAEALDSIPASAAIEQLFDRAAVQAAFEGVGGADACLAMALAYVAERKIFGRTLSSYQAIKHKLANVATDIELARSNAYYGGWAAVHGPDQLPLAASSARLSAIKTFENAARENIQVHGGIGYTFEANCHFYYRRERTLATHLGNREDWAERLIANIPGSQAEAA
jgi:acyl-CoA dehydrogenase